MENLESLISAYRNQISPLQIVNSHLKKRKEELEEHSKKLDEEKNSIPKEMSNYKMWNKDLSESCFFLSKELEKLAAKIGLEEKAMMDSHKTLEFEEKVRDEEKQRLKLRLEKKSKLLENIKNQIKSISEEIKELKIIKSKIEDEKKVLLLQKDQKKNLYEKLVSDIKNKLKNTMLQ